MKSLITFSSESECDAVLVTWYWRLISSPCTEDRCGTYGSCQLKTTLQNLFSTCRCIAGKVSHKNYGPFVTLHSGYRGFGCTDGRGARVWTYLRNVLMLTLSNLIFLPAIIWALYHGLYIESLVYFFNMFFSIVSNELLLELETCSF